MLSPTRAPIILLVEDSDDDAYFFRRTLKKSGAAHELIWLQDGRSAVQHFERQRTVDGPAVERPDIIFLDLKLPSFTGFDVLEWYAASGIPPDAPIIVLSGSDHPSDLDRAAKLGASGYLVKPVDAQQLLELLAGHALGSPLEVPS